MSTDSPALGKSKKVDYSDTSFMIAIQVLKDAQQRIEKQTGVRRKIKCFFSEKDATAYGQMTTAVARFNRPQEGFEIRTSHGEFVDAVSELSAFVGQSFPLIFIDPTGWTEYPFAKIAPLFAPRKCEVISNFMYGHISRFISHPDEKITSSLRSDPWRTRLEGPSRSAVEAWAGRRVAFPRDFESCGGSSITLYRRRLTRALKIDLTSFWLTEPRTEAVSKHSVRPNMKRFANMRGTAQRQ